MKQLFVLALMLPIMAMSQDKQQCKGTKTDGKPCGIYVAKPASFCHWHNPDAIKCGFIKRDGKPCRMIVKEKGKRCDKHAGK